MADRLLRLEKACRQNPDSPLFARLADLYLRRGKVFRALNLCEKGCERFPGYTTGFQILSKCYEAQGELEEARRALDRALDLDSESPGGFKQLSRIYQDLGMSDMALKSLEQAAQLDPLDQNLSEQVDQLACALRVESTTEPEEAFDVLPEEASDTAPPEVDTEIDQVDYLEPESGDVGDAGEEDLEMDDRPQDSAEEPVFAEEVDAEPEEPAEAAWREESSASQPDAGELDDGGVDDIVSLDAQTLADRPETSSVVETERDDPASDSRIDEDLQEEDSRLEEQEEVASPATAEDSVEAPIPQKPASRSRNHSGGVNAVSGLAPRDDDELLRMFQEIEAQQTQGTASDSSSPTGESGLSSIAEGDTATSGEDSDRQIATVTLAEIYTIQGLTRRAIDTYEQIIEQDPGNKTIRQKLADLKRGTKNS